MTAGPKRQLSRDGSAPLSAAVFATLLIGCGSQPGEPTSEARAGLTQPPVAQIERLVPAGDPFLHREGASISAVNNKLYLVRGVAADVETQTNTFPTDVVQLHKNAKAKQLSQDGASSPGGLAYHCTAADEHDGAGALYLFGGANYVFQARPDFFASLTVSDALFRYDLAHETWQRISTAGARPSARSGCAAELLDGALFMFAGLSRFFVVNNEMWRFDPDSQTWQLLAPNGPLPPPRFRPASALDHETGKIYYYSGHAIGPNFTQPRLGDFWVYDIATNTFEQLPSQIDPPRDEGTISVLEATNGRKYVVHVAGHTESPTQQLCAGFPEALSPTTDEIWAYDVEARSWSLLETTGDPAPRLHFHAGARLHDEYYFATGWREEPDPVRVCQQVFEENVFRLTLVAPK